MSVLIKGMNMPKDCRECRLNDYSTYTGDTWCGVSDRILAKNFKAIGFDGRPDWCPLVEVKTPHGRLIDAELLKTEFPHDTDWEYPVNTNEYVADTINEQPTVIDAEVEE